MDSSFNDQGNYSKTNNINLRNRDLSLHLQDGPNNFEKSKCSFNSPVALNTPDLEGFNSDILERFFPVRTSSIPSSPLPNAKDFGSWINSKTNSSQNGNNLQIELQRNNNANNNRNGRESSSNNSMNTNNNPYDSVLPTVVLRECVAVKDEPQTVPSFNSSPNMSPIPIDMGSQEAFKLQRKRQNNRVAASKCRKNKLEKIAKLEDKVKYLKSENHDLASTLSKLKVEIYNLKEKVVKHYRNGCSI